MVVLVSRGRCGFEVQGKKLDVESNIKMYLRKLK